MDGWSQATQASHWPSGEGRGAATKSRPSTRGTTANEPSTATPTRRCRVSAAVGATRSSIDTSHRPDRVSRPSA